MLTIDEIKDVKFRTNRGQSFYKAEDVDAFIDEVIETLEMKNNEKAELVHKMDILATRIEQYRSDEETVRNALLSAQKVADSTLKEANEQSEVSLKNAKEKGIKAVNGLYMLAAQAVYSQCLWNGISFDADITDKIFSELKKNFEKQNF